MKSLGLILPVLVLAQLGSARANNVPTEPPPELASMVPSSIKVDSASLTITFGPVDLPTRHHEDLAKEIPKRVFEVPRDMFITGYKARVIGKDGVVLSGPYVHHILMSKLDDPSLACPGELNFFAGTGFEMTEARFPEGYGVKLEKGQKVLAIVDFYHDAPAIRDVIVAFTMDLARDATALRPLLAYHVGVNFGCYTKFHLRPKDETIDGITLKTGLFIRSAPLKFEASGCVKYAYPHAHDDVVLMTLENKSARQTLIRTMPLAQADGRLIGFPPSQIYSSVKGFPVNTEDQYEVTMVYHTPLQDTQARYGMANFLLFLAREDCSLSSDISAEIHADRRH